ncbi:MAG: DEAD/DEAH box helicase family protein [Phycisphaerae bacterium]|nr:DEAD/DEAH box helicase family protein [Phycisphaerae bacterium]
MPTSGITHLIINSPYEEPKQHWLYQRETRTFSLESGRRPAGYVIASESSKSFDDPGRFIAIELVNQIRPRVKAWRGGGYPGVTGITRRLLEHWNDPDEREGRRFFFCQLEAIETLIWLTEAPASERVGIEIPDDGGAFPRWCSKMATGSGKTIVMAQLIAWQVLNKVAYPQDDRFSKNVFVVAPGLTVWKRLQVLEPARPGNYYDEFNIVPGGTLREQLRQGRVLVRNWHVLNWETDDRLRKKRRVDKRGAKSDEAYVRDVLRDKDMANVRNIIVINDEAHHAWRVNPESKKARIERLLIEEATKWVGGLDRIHRARRILRCFDFSATPFAPSGKTSSEEALFGWIVSDFGLNDAIEAGLVKTPRVVVRDDGMPDVKSYKSKLYHIYEHVRDDLIRSAEEFEPLPDLVMNAFLLLGKDWLVAQRAWKDMGHLTPPVMITVANRTETAARVKYAFDKKKVMIDELCNPELALHIDSKVLELAEAKEEEAETQQEGGEAEGNDEPKEKKLTKAEQAELLRKKVDTVGKVGEPGEKIQNVISVGMLSEGWDAKTVTHIMGLRAFSSQLLCEQVVGRGLRRTSYEVDQKTGLFSPEYVNIFGIPFTFLPHEGDDDGPLPPPPPKTRIEPVREKAQFAISWPNIIRIDHVYRPKLELDLDRVEILALNATDKIENAEMAAIVAGKPNMAVLTEIDLLALAERFRLQRIVFEVAREVYDQMRPTWKGAKESLLAQVIRLVEQFITSPKLEIHPPLFYQDELKRRVMLTLNMRRIVQHVFEQIRFANTLTLEPVFDTSKPIRSTGDMQPWHTGKPCVPALRSHINLCVVDSTWEAQPSYELDHNPAVAAWVKNDHLGFEVKYIFEGAFHKYRPDFLVRLAKGTTLLLEIKGQDTPKDQAKRKYLAEWVKAVNAHGGFGKWVPDVALSPADIPLAIHRSAALDQAYGSNRATRGLRDVDRHQG